MGIAKGADRQRGRDDEHSEDGVSSGAHIDIDFQEAADLASVFAGSDCQPVKEVESDSLDMWCPLCSRCLALRQMLPGSWSLLKQGTPGSLLSRRFCCWVTRSRILHLALLGILGFAIRRVSRRVLKVLTPTTTIWKKVSPGSLGLILLTATGNKKLALTRLPYEMAKADLQKPAFDEVGEHMKTATKSKNKNTKNNIRGDGMNNQVEAKGEGSDFPHGDLDLEYAACRAPFDGAASSFEGAELLHCIGQHLSRLQELHLRLGKPTHVVENAQAGGGVGTSWVGWTFCMSWTSVSCE